MVLVGYYEGLDSQRGMAWQWADRLALGVSGVALTEATPVHAFLTVIRQQLPESVFDRVFVFVLALVQDHGLLRGKTGGGRRSWLRGQTNVSKLHTLKCAAYNLGLLLCKVWGYCKPRRRALSLVGSVGTDSSDKLAEPRIGYVAGSSSDTQCCLSSGPQTVAFESSPAFSKNVIFNGPLTNLAGF